MKKHFCIFILSFMVVFSAHAQTRNEPSSNISETCKALKNACLYKDERGERGQGNCKRYRAECTTAPAPENAKPESSRSMQKPDDEGAVNTLGGGVAGRSKPQP